MGGDLGPRLCVPASLKFLRSFPGIQISLVGQRSLIEPLLVNIDTSVRARISLVDAEQVVEMAERAGAAYRHKRQSSMWYALSLVAEERADACVSAGNTGALMAMSRHLVKTIGNMGRPAICKPIPTACGQSYLLDMGANLNCSPEQLLQFAIMGAALAQVNGCKSPTVALMNVGAETTKGNQDIKRAYALLENHPDINFRGFIEGSSLYGGEVDVIVCDGFVGNVALKVSEGAALFILNSLKHEFTATPWRKLLAMLNHFALKHWRERFNPSKYNGAALLGLRKIVIKSHGGASSEGFFEALVTAKQQVEAEIPLKLETLLKNIKSEDVAVKLLREQNQS